MFRSHLMQQFASAARTQSRPPLALASSLSRGQQTTITQSTDDERRDARLAASASSLSAATLAAAAAASSRRRVSTSVSTAAITPVPGLSSPFSRRALSIHSSSAAVAPRPRRSHDASTESAALFQSLIQSRRTVGKWDNDGNARIDSSYLSSALDRAIVCARHAPNHKRTEPFRFVRMLHGGIEQLADICYHVTLQRKLPKDPEHAESLAASKRDKWASIPAYLATLVDQSNRDQTEEGESTNHLGDYEELPFVPPQTERQLEDYASASAAVQNVLLSLHAEGLATKWATGPIVNTRAFRNLCRVRETERVVGLVMVGVAQDSTIKPRRFRKTWDDLVQDL